MEEGINFKDIAETIKKHFILIISITILAILISAIITFFVITPQYQASTQILVNQSENAEEETSTTDIESSRELINTYNVIITSPAILQPTIENSNFEGSVEELRSKISVSAEEDSQVANVIVEDEDPRRAVALANALGQTFEQQISNIMNVDNVSVLAEAEISSSDSPISPQPSLNLAGALIIGLMIGIGVAFLLEFLDQSIKTEKDIEKELNLPILGSVPMIEESGPKPMLNNNTTNKNQRSNNRDSQRKML